MLPKSGNGLPKSTQRGDAEYVQRISEALRQELGSSARATKTVVRWTGASDRIARTWVSGQGGPSAVHLLALARQSNSVWRALQLLAGREEFVLAADLHAVEVALARAQGSFEVLRRQHRVSRPN